MSHLPPGPRWGLPATIRYLRDPYGALLAAARKYGDPYGWPSAFGRMVITGSPAGAQTVFSADPDNYVALGAEVLGPVLGESNLILLSGDRHKAMRKLQAPPFHARALSGYGGIILEVARAHVARWPRDRTIDVHRTMQRISLEVILRTVFGETATPGRLLAVEKATLAVVGALKPSFMFIRGLRRSFGGLSAWARFQRARAGIARLFADELRLRRADERPREDILSQLMAARDEDGQPLSDDDLQTQVMNLIGAGHETTASALAWALHAVHRDPGVKRALVEALGRLPPGPWDPEAVARLPYLEAVCHEALRLNPVAPLIGRTLRTGLTLEGYDLPAGISVGVGIVNIHRRADLYPEPERFRPERFVERQFGPFEYLPFGGGARRCLGAAFALYEMKLVLAAVMVGPSLELADDDGARAAARNTTVGPARGVRMHLV
jgi:cytochrome P450 family 110